MGTAVSEAAREAMASRHASSASLVIGPERKPAEPMVVFYRLSRKFVDTEKSVPGRATDIMYYTLAIGHHTGVIDCFDEAVSCPLPVYEQVCSLVDDEDARYKLAGILRSGEIQVLKSDLPTLVEPLREALDEDGAPAEAVSFMEGLLGLLELMESDSALYLMGRKRMP